MIKRILIASLLLFMPIFANGETLVIGSSESFKEKNLPLDTRLLDRLISESEFVCVAEADRDLWCQDKWAKSNFVINQIRTKFFQSFVSGEVSIPFSVRDLYGVCVKHDAWVIANCYDFILKYATDVVKVASDISACKAGAFKSSNKFAKVQTKTLDDATSLIKNSIHCDDADLSAIKCTGQCNVAGQDFVTCTWDDLTATFEFNDICDGKYKEKIKNVLKANNENTGFSPSDYRDIADFAR